MCEPFEDIFPEQEKFICNSVYLCFQKPTLKAKVEGKEKQSKKQYQGPFQKASPSAMQEGEEANPASLQPH